jgi:chaperone modulatory protein CbpM
VIHITMVTQRFPELTQPRIVDWVARGWVRAEGPPDDWAFSERDVDRLLLLWELNVDLAIDRDALPVVLSLLDQVASLRAALVAVAGQWDNAPEALRQRVADALDRSRQGN